VITVVRLPAMQTWIVTARDGSGRETPIGLVAATDAKTALYRGTIKAARLFGTDARRQVIVRPTSPQQ
jgi:hypothetical protein